MTRVAVSPEMLRWAVERSRRGAEPLSRRFPALPVWERGEAKPTLKQLESFAKAAHIPFGYLFLPEPPDERVPIPDFRTAAATRIERPSPALLDTIYLCQQRQEWYRDYARTEGI
jgi:transcriptional regulator with XRE-family HTH domain